MQFMALGLMFCAVGVAVIRYRHALVEHLQQAPGRLVQGSYDSDLFAVTFGGFIAVGCGIVTFGIGFERLVLTS